MTDRIEAVARAIGKACWGSEVIPAGNWLVAAEAAIAAYEQALAAEGMVSLPREPTEGMIEAMHEAAYFDEGYGYDTSIDNPADAYRAMITAYEEQ